jgi:hypothetical protein
MFPLKKKKRKRQKTKAIRRNDTTQMPQFFTSFTRLSSFFIVVISLFITPSSKEARAAGKRAPSSIFLLQKPSSMSAMRTIKERTGATADPSTKTSSGLDPSIFSDDVNISSVVSPGRKGKKKITEKEFNKTFEDFQYMYHNVTQKPREFNEAKIAASLQRVFELQEKEEMKRNMAANPKPPSAEKSVTLPMIKTPGRSPKK